MSLPPFSSPPLSSSLLFSPRHPSSFSFPFPSMVAPSISIHFSPATLPSLSPSFPPTSHSHHLPPPSPFTSLPSWRLPPPPPPSLLLGHPSLSLPFFFIHFFFSLYSSPKLVHEPSHFMAAPSISIHFLQAIHLSLSSSFFSSPSPPFLIPLFSSFSDSIILLFLFFSNPNIFLFLFLFFSNATYEMKDEEEKRVRRKGEKRKEKGEKRKEKGEGTWATEKISN